MNRRLFVRAGLAGAAAALRGPIASAAGRGTATDPRYAFALVGDIPYNTLEERALARVFADFDPGVAFAIHVGDLKSGWESCGDALLASRREVLGASPVPLVFTPGDNEWLDCARTAAGGHAPLERLAKLRELFHDARPTDAALAGLERQRTSEHDFPENRRWRAGPALFATVNLPGSHNGVGAGAAVAEHNGLRAAANEAWLREAFAIATRERLAGVVVVAHANPGFEREHRALGLPGSARPRDEYHGFRRLLRELVRGHPQQVLFLHGDTHRFRVDRPMRDARGVPLANFLRVECFGSPFATYWVRITVDQAMPSLFSVTWREV